MDHTSLFPGLDDPPIERPVHNIGPFASVAIERSLDKVLDYSIPSRLVGLIKVGQRVKVPLGKRNRPTPGYVVALSETSDTTRQTKPLFSIDDARVLLPPGLMDLARWMSRYYCCALGTVIESIVPSAVKKKVGLGYIKMVRLEWPRDKAQELFEKTKAPKRRAVLARILQIPDGESVELIRIAGEANAKAASVRKLAKAGVISITAEPDFSGSLGGMSIDAPAQSPEPIPDLNDDQERVFTDLLPRVKHGGFSVNLLHGVTGSGKTEIYLRCIAEAVALGRKAIVLVPEIALTPQTVRRFTARFPRVAILHSGLAASARHRFWSQISRGEADVVVGARSAVFAPLPDIGVIVVDEEHEGSYKQDTAPRYHARDVAIKRGQIEGVPVILGSATPSLESWWRANGLAETASADRLSPHHLLSLSRRVRGLQLPHIELVDMKQEIRLRKGRGVHLLSKRLEHLLRTTVEARHQAILLLNRRGYANFVYCPSCTHLVQCKYCDVTLTYHRMAGVNAKGASSAEGLHTGQLHCHYCLAVNPLPSKCPDCGKKLSLFGLGTQRVEEELKHKFPDLRFARVDGDTMHSARDYEALLGQFSRGEIQVLLGTQMIAKGLDYPNVTLVGVVSGDTALALPDFRAAERTFQLITQVAGRAGRGDAPGRVVLQTFSPDDPTIQAAIRQDYVRFAESELRGRTEVGLPPATRMVRIILRDEDLDKLHDRSQRLAAALAGPVSRHAGQVKLKGPMPCAINRIAGYHRAQILLFSPGPVRLQQVLADAREEKAFSDTDRIAVDVDPVSLL